MWVDQFELVQLMCKAKCYKKLSSFIWIDAHQIHIWYDWCAKASVNWCPPGGHVIWPVLVWISVPEISFYGVPVTMISKVVSFSLCAFEIILQLWRDVCNVFPEGPVIHPSHSRWTTHHPCWSYSGLPATLLVRFTNLPCSEISLIPKIFSATLAVYGSQSSSEATGR